MKGWINRVVAQACLRYLGYYFVIALIILMIFNVIRLFNHFTFTNGPLWCDRSLIVLWRFFYYFSELSVRSLILFTTYYYLALPFITFHTLWCWVWALWFFSNMKISSLSIITNWKVSGVFKENFVDPKIIKLYRSITWCFKSMIIC